MIARHRVVPNCYRDSVALLALAARAAELDGVDRASITMATPANVEAAVEIGVLEPIVAGPNDVLVLVSSEDGEDGEDGAAVLDAALDQLVAWLVAPAVRRPDASMPEATTVAEAMGRSDEAGVSLSVALISVPGPFAAAEARKALDRGLHVMIFSDNVSVDHEIALKEHGRRLGRLVMGPDCGTSVLDGVPLGFANALRRGAVGLVGASGTGLQEVSTTLHRLGGGISQLIGTGGRDLGAAVGGRATLAALDLLGADPATEVIVVVSKPPDPAVAERVLAHAAALGKPVVAALLGCDPALVARPGVHAAADLADAARLALALSTGADPLPAAASSPALDAGSSASVDGTAGRGVLRGLFSGGTLGYEAQLVLGRHGITVASNAPAPGQHRAPADPFQLDGHLVVDLGADEFTEGRPHPMIDPDGRNQRLAEALADPRVAVVLFDVVLGYGAAADPLGGLLDVLAAGRAAPGPVCIAHVCGTDDDPYPRRRAVEQLRAAGVRVAAGNADAAAQAASLLSAVAVVR